MSFTSSVSAFILSFVDLIAFDIVGLVYVYVYVHLCGREREREAPRRYTTNGNNSLLLVNDEHYYYGALSCWGVLGSLFGKIRTKKLALFHHCYR